MEFSGGNMRLQKCNKNHFYNGEKFKKCPYCALEKSGIEEDTDTFDVHSTDVTEKDMERSE